MNIKELKKILKKFDEDTLITIKHEHYSLKSLSIEYDKFYNKDVLVIEY